MFTFDLQDWITIRGDKTVTSFSQGGNGWIALPEFQDVVFWTQTRGVNLGGGSLTLRYETSPLAESSLFQAMGTFTVPNDAGQDRTSILLNHNPTVPLAQWVRWTVQATTPTSTWAITFRIRVAANATTTYHLRS